jgi:hypothetical protein
MAIQDDIMAMLSQVSDAGDRATDRGRQGSEMYGRMADLLSGDNLSKAMREIAMLSDDPEQSIEEQMSFDPLTGSRVADIIEKYMDDAGDGVPAAVPDDMIVDDTRAAERMMEVMPSPETAPRTPVSVERPDFDEAALESMERDIRQSDEGLAGLMAGQEAPEAGLLVGTPPTPIQTGGYYGEFAGTPGTSIAPARVSNGDIPLKERLFAGQEAAGGPMSGTEQLMLGSVFISPAALPAAAARVGIGAAQVARFLRGGKKGEEALRQVIRQRTVAQMRDPATGRFLGRKDIGPFDPRVRLSGKPRVRVPAQTQAMNEGGSIRDGIMRNYAMMADGKSVSRHLGIKPEQGKSTFPKYEMYFPTSPEEISDIRDRLDEDKSYGRQIRKYFNPYYLSDVLSKMGKDD